jgi:hypothetical protein
MSNRRLFTTDLFTIKSQLRNTTRGQRLTVIALVSVAILCFAVAEFAYSQGPPDWVISEHALGNSPFADYGPEEVPITVKGVLTILHGDDFVNKRGKFFYFLRNIDTNETLELRFADKEPGNLRSGATVKARGRAKGRVLYLALDESGAESIETLLPAQIAVAGEQKTLVMVANFIDDSVFCSVDEIQDLMFTDPNGSSIDEFYQETSSGNIWFSGDVAGPYTIDYTSTDTCNIGAWADAADAAALADGIDPGAYTRKVYVLPSSNGCGSYAGIGQVGGSPTKAWIFYCYMEDVYAHELGHNLGMYHASTPNSEYGDTACIMGAGNLGLRHLNSAHQDEMGWRSPAMNLLTTESGIYDLAPQSLYEDQSLAPQILRIAKPDTNEYYYIAYRRPLGFDSNLQWWHHDVVTVHRYKGAEGPPTNTYLLDELGVGDSFIDEVNNITVSHINQTPDYATVQIDLNGNTACIAGAPTVSLAPTSQSGGPGDTLSYAVSVTNANSLCCAASSFALSEAVPYGWTGTLSTTTLNLAPGQTGTATLAVTSAISAAANTYGVSVNVNDSGEAEQATSGSASYTVVQDCAAAAPGLSLSPSSQSGDSGDTLTYTISLINKDSTACNASTFDLAITSLPGSWSGNLSRQSLSLSPGSTGTATLSVTSAQSSTAGAYSVQLEAADAQEALHANSTASTYIVNDTSPPEDTEPPTAPDGLSASLKGKNIKLTWNAATDNVGVSGYAVWRDGARIGDTTDTAYVDSSVPSSMTCTYRVSAFDAAGNMSASSNIVSVTARGSKGKPKK